MKKYFLTLSTALVFLLVLFFCLRISAYTYFPSFEIYNNPENPECGKSLNCTSYPTVTDVKVSGPDNDVVTITANAHDVSGVLSVIAIIKSPSGKKIMQSMQNILGFSYGTSVNVANYPDGVYTVDISAIDTLLNNSMHQGDEYKDIGSFRVGSSSGWLEGWSYRKKITISNTNVDSDLTNFPLLVSFTNDYDIWENVSDNINGYDIRFTDSNGKILPYERESFSVISGSASGNFWVQVPTIYSSQTENQNIIYIYYGNPLKASSDWTAGGSPKTRAQQVWDSNYKLVYHFKEITDDKWVDSTSNKNDGNNSGATVVTTGKIGNAANFDPKNYSSVLSTENIDIVTENSFTVEAWVYPRSNGRVYDTDDYGRCIVGWGDDNCSKAYFLYYDNDNLRNRFEVGYYCNDYYNTPRLYPSSNWYYAVNTYNNLSNIMFVNGNESFSWTPDAVYTEETEVMIGLDPFYQNRYYDGIIDEFRISNIARSKSWIKFGYYNIVKSSHEITFDSQEEVE